MDEKDLAIVKRFEEFLRVEDEKEQARLEALYPSNFECDCQQCMMGLEDRRA